MRLCSLTFPLHGVVLVFLCEDLSAGRCPCGNKCSVKVQGAAGMTCRNVSRKTS